jgi:hypothetical protein
MKNFSVLPARNLQFIQFIPELHSLKLGVHQMDGTKASQAPISRFNTNSLFNLPENLKDGVANMELFNDHPDSGSSVMVFPNPANNLLRVSCMLKSEGMLTARIINILGAEASIRDIPGSIGNVKLELDISHLPNGAYFLMLDLPDGVYNHKFNILK